MNCHDKQSVLRKYSPIAGEAVLLGRYTTAEFSALLLGVTRWMGPLAAIPSSACCFLIMETSIFWVVVDPCEQRPLPHV